MSPPSAIRHPHSTIPDPRRGVTLAEVLVSLGIMSLGVVTLATLFPLSVLRTVQATQLTGATIHRYHASATISAIPNLVQDPDGDNDPTTGNPAGTNYVVDPMGFVRYQIDGVTDNTKFGFSDDMGADAMLGIERFGFGFDAGSLTPPQQEQVFLDATGFVTSPDSWTDLLEADADEFTLNLAVTPPTPQTISFTAAELAPVSVGDRIVFFHDNGRASETRTITGPDPVANPVEFLPPLPANYTAARVATARIETQYLRYSWLLTVRNSAGVANVNAVVFFNRGVGIEDELVYTADFTDKMTTATLDHGTLPEPRLKAGGYVLDAENLFWYRIARVAKSGTVFTLELAETAKSDSTSAIVMPQIIEVYPIGSYAP